ncbi:MAG: metallophosphoesterase [Verrucomicrobia bacterium]|nr:metallophosphoesterase [Verrucomicrobiota bacterium]
MKRIQSRRDFLGIIGAGAVGAALAPQVWGEQLTSGTVRRVLAMSDLHIGKIDDSKDGSEWLRLALEDLAENLPDISCGLVLGDITQNGQEDGLDFYLQQIRGHRIARWFELAGNHEYYYDRIGNYTRLIRPIDPYMHTDGNVAYFFLSDEKHSREGNVSKATCRWLREQLQKHRDHTTIVCSHQCVADTVRKSGETYFYLHPRRELEDILNTCNVDVWLCGHEHHSPYTREKIAYRGGTTFINVASLNHAYGTRGSGSSILEFAEGSRKLRVRRRDHDQRFFRPEFDVIVPLRTEYLPGQTDPA